MKQGITTISVLLVFLLVTGADAMAQADYEVTAKKVYAKYSACQAERYKDSMRRFEEESQLCMEQASERSLDECDDIADRKITLWENSSEFKLMCESLRPTTYKPRTDPYGVELVGSLGAMSAFNDGKYATGVKMFEECASVGDADCSYRLGLLKYTGNNVQKDEAEALQLLRFAAKNGHEQARKMLLDIGKGN